MPCSDEDDGGSDEDDGVVPVVPAASRAPGQFYGAAPAARGVGRRNAAAVNQNGRYSAYNCTKFNIWNTI